MKPILFNTDMVRAILDGRKTVTRRVVKTKHKDACGFYVTTRKSDGAFMGVYEYDENESMFDNPLEPPYKVNDILYVRETWYRGINRILYKANYSENEKFYRDGKEILIKWKPSIHMPKEAARLFLKVTGVKVAKLRDMELIDFLNEGIIVPPDPVIENEKLLAMDKFIDLWNSTAGKKGTPEYYANNWYGNPYVWVIEFEVISREQAEEE